MTKKLIAIISFLLICQFCVKAQNWQSVGTGLFGYVNGMVADTANHKIYASGYWGSAHRFIQYNDSTGNWSLLGNNYAFNNTYAVTIYHGEIYGATFNGIFKLVGQNWQCVAPTHGQAVGFCLNDTSLYAYGNFDSIAGVQAIKIARFDGTAWHNIGYIPVNNTINCATFFQGELYVGGNIENSSMGLYKIMKWNGSQWLALAGTNNCFTGGFDWIDCIATYNNDLYIGGYFNYSAGGNPGNNISKWDGGSWNAIGGGADFQVFSLQEFNGKLWVGGQFTNAGGIPAPYLATWDGIDWCNVGDFDNAINCFLIYNNELYVGGGFQMVDGDTVNKVVKWIGGNNTNGCGHLNTGMAEEVQPNLTVIVFPNPVSSIATFQISGVAADRTILVFDQLGREIWRKETDENSIEFSAAGFAPGLYYYRVKQNGELKSSGKFLIE